MGEKGTAKRRKNYSSAAKKNPRSEEKRAPISKRLSMCEMGSRKKERDGREKCDVEKEPCERRGRNNRKTREELFARKGLMDKGGIL